MLYLTIAFFPLSSLGHYCTNSAINTFHPPYWSTIVTHHNDIKALHVCLKNKKIPKSDQQLLRNFKIQKKKKKKREWTKAVCMNCMCDHEHDEYTYIWFNVINKKLWKSTIQIHYDLIQIQNIIYLMKCIPRIVCINVRIISK